jgi:hypothetical protein
MDEPRESQTSPPPGKPADERRRDWAAIETALLQRVAGAGEADTKELDSSGEAVD